MSFRLQEGNMQPLYTLRKSPEALLGKIQTITPFVGENKGAMQTTLQHSFRLNQLNLVILECLPAYMSHKGGEIGKIVDVGADLMTVVPAFQEAEEIIELSRVFGQWGINVSLWTFLGDDDYKYSVGESFRDIVTAQLMTGIMSNKIADCFAGQFAKLQTNSWLNIEQSMDLTQQRANVQQKVKQAVEGGGMLGAVGKLKERFAIMLEGRQAYCAQNLLTLDNEYLVDQALQELTSYVFQLTTMKEVVKNLGGVGPIVFLNTFPGLNNVDWGVVTWVSSLGLTKDNYPMLGFDNPVGRNKKNIVMTCGDPTGWKGSK